jgi:hypothetical protein
VPRAITPDLRLDARRLKDHPPLEDMLPALQQANVDGSTHPTAQTRMPPSGNGLHDSTQQLFLQPSIGVHTRVQQSLFPLNVKGPVR